MWDCAPGLSQLVWGALRTVDLVLIPYIPDRTAEDNVGWLGRRLHGRDRMSRTIANASTPTSGHTGDPRGQRPPRTLFVRSVAPQ
jgi:hypothetical protein